jgi:hypothetical protein
MKSPSAFCSGVASCQGRKAVAGIQRGVRVGGGAPEWSSTRIRSCASAIRSWLVGSSWRSIKLELGNDALELAGCPGSPGN